VKYKPIGTRWIVAAFAIVAVLGALCEMAAGNKLTLPQSLWLLPDMLLYPVGLALVGLLIGRFRHSRRQQPPDGAEN
jgi:hypothetical protein